MLLGSACLIVLGVTAWLSVLNGWDPLRSKNRSVEAGNRAIGQGNVNAALSHYDKAIKTLPSEPGVHLNRGLALRALGKEDLAQQAFRTASELNGSRKIRAEAFYNLGIGVYQHAEKLLTQKDYTQAQQGFKDAVEAFKQALRLAPGHQKAAWNLELALLQLQDAQQKQQQQENEKKEQDEKSQDSSKDPQDKNKENPSPQQPQEQNKQPSESKPKDATSSQPEPTKPKDSPSTQTQPLPAEAEQVLDTLQKREENLERHKARLRSLQENRRPLKDW